MSDDLYGIRKRWKMQPTTYQGDVPIYTEDGLCVCSVPYQVAYGIVRDHNATLLDDHERRRAAGPAPDANPTHSCRYGDECHGYPRCLCGCDSCQASHVPAPSHNGTADLIVALEQIEAILDPCAMGDPSAHDQVNEAYRIVRAALSRARGARAGG